ncbi:MAG: MarR family transcriptional regulator [Cellvibrionaceae bacterium]|nr:MarR family transcriptional regulator [Cellvibrionaceae bacterium]MCV6625007.1 MarR family transcriptional regulator [Cellvibrionaceae bacterium]
MQSNHLIDADDGDKDIAWALSDIARLATAEFMRRVKAMNLPVSQAQGRILLRLLRQNGQTQTELAESMGMEKAPLGVLIDKMESTDLIKRRPDPKDGRMRRVFLTDRGEALCPAMDEVSEQLLADMFAGLSQMQRLQLGQGLDHIMRNLIMQRNSQ